MPHVSANGINLYYELHGPEQAPVVVLNNGILMNTASWQMQTPVLARYFRVLLYDCRGQWQSDHPGGKYTMQLHADDLAGLLHALHIPRAHIAGISYGGEVAQAFALHYPERVRSLILADTVSEVGPELRETVGRWKQVALTGDSGRFFDATLPGNFSPDFVQTHPALMQEAKRRYAELDFDAVARLCDAFLDSVNFTPRLHEITAPACIIVGEADMLKGRPYAERLKQGIPHAQFHLLAGAGHASSWERPREFNAIVVGFLTMTQG